MFIFSVQLSNAQNNSVKRIDSLTHAFMQGTTPKQKIILTPDELNNLTEERFNELVSTLGSTIEKKCYRFIYRNSKRNNSTRK